MENCSGEVNSRWILSKHTHIPIYFLHMSLVSLAPFAITNGAFVWFLASLDPHIFLRSIFISKFLPHMEHTFKSSPAWHLISFVKDISPLFFPPEMKQPFGFSPVGVPCPHVCCKTMSTKDHLLEEKKWNDRACLTIICRIAGW